MRHREKRRGKNEEGGSWGVDIGGCTEEFHANCDDVLMTDRD